MPLPHGDPRLLPEIRYASGSARALYLGLREERQRRVKKQTEPCWRLAAAAAAAAAPVAAPVLVVVVQQQSESTCLESDCSAKRSERWF